MHRAHAVLLQAGAHLHMAATDALVVSVGRKFDCITHTTLTLCHAGAAQSRACASKHFSTPNWITLRNTYTCTFHMSRRGDESNDGSASHTFDQST